MSDEDFEDVDEKLQELNQRINEWSGKCYYRTMMRVAHEARRLARVEQRLMPYLDASFHVMNDSRNTLHPVGGREVAIELITLLESEERARQFQPNLPEEEYERTKWWLTACSYDNLAVHTASCNGCNSDGMHECITDGIQVCRRTGKLQCISCFREYATDVYVAADDLDMALHHARVGINNKDPGPHDRRHVGAKDSVRILMLKGEVDAAIEMLDLAWELSEVYHSPYAGKLDSYNRALELYYLAGCPERMDKLPRRLTSEEGEQYQGPPDAVLIEPPRDEFPSYSLDRDMTSSFVACCQGDFETAAQLIQPWDVTLREQKCLSKWFEVRLRLIAIQRLTGKMARAQSLAKPLLEAAKPARDWMTLRRLELLLDESAAATPLVLAAPVKSGPFAAKTTVAMVGPIPEHDATSVPANAEAAESASSEDNQTPRTPLGNVIAGFYQRLMESAGDEDKVASIVADVLAIEPAAVTNADDASQLLHLIRFASNDAERAAEVWNWAQAIVQQHSQNPRVLSMLGSLGAKLRDLPDAAVEELITTERLDDLFRQSLDLDPNAADNFARAGTYHLEQENYGEAERCLARGFRLNRSSGFLALRLAEVYSRTDRPRDALAVLDMALREGCDDSDVAWQAAMTANHLDQFESVLTYLDRFDELLPDQPWSNHYRASALLELNRPAESLAALDKEAEFNPDATYHVLLQRVSCLAGLKQENECRDALATLLAVPLTTVTYLTTSGLQHLFGRMWRCITENFPPDDPAVQQIESRLLQTGLAPNEMFAAYRQRTDQGSEPGNVNFYRCLVRQPLDSGWPSFPGCLASEEEWIAYEVSWGVLATDQESAGPMVLEWQQRCYPLPAEIVEIEEGGTDYTDHSGIVWQGYREGRSPDPAA